MVAFVVIDVETVPLDRVKYDSLSEDERLKLLNPIDSRVVAVGLKHAGQHHIFLDVDERVLLESFWRAFESVRSSIPGGLIVGFNCKNFDFPFLVTRSFCQNVRIVPFLLKHIIDLREKLSAYRSGHVRGSLKDFARFLGRSPDDDGSAIAAWWWNKEFDRIRAYLSDDLDMTEEVFLRARELRITEIEKW